MEPSEEGQRRFLHSPVVRLHPRFSALRRAFPERALILRALIPIWERLFRQRNPALDPAPTFFLATPISVLRLLQDLELEVEEPQVRQALSAV